MLTDQQLIDELQSALNRKASDVTPPPGLLEAVHRELASDPWPRWPRRRRGGLVVALSVAATAVVVALALLFVHTGHPAPTRPGGYAPPSTGLAVVTSDPRGGRPWELINSGGSGDVTCVHVGRPRSSELFIPVVGDCGKVDREGQAFMDAFARQVPATPGARACRRGQLRGCRLSVLRNVAFGLLGPEAVSVSYVGPYGHTITEPTGADGAYLVVLPATARSCVLVGGGVACNSGAGITRASTLTSGVLTAVTYRDGSVCRLPAPSPHGVRRITCPRVVAGPTGYRPPTVTAAQVSAPITAHAIRAERFCVPINAGSVAQSLPCEGPVPKGYTALASHVHGLLLIQLTFIARRAASNVHSIYEWSFRERASDPGCAGAGSRNEANTMAPIRTGQRVVLAAFEGPCPGRYSGLVTYQPNAPSPRALNPNLPIRDGSVLVGRFSLAVR